MRCFVTLVFIFTIVGAANATDLGTTQKIIKDNTHIGMNPGTPDERQGGEDMASAIVIDNFPFNDTGNTTDNMDDYDVACPYSGSTSADVVYSFTPEFDVPVTVDLCGSGYDTKTYIMDGDMNLIACNDDFYNDEICGMYVSMIEMAYLTAGTEYFIVVDGYGGDSGDYNLELREYEFPPPCVLTCDGIAEGEPPLMDGYEDAFNGGCNSPEFGNPFLDLLFFGDTNGDLTLCGVSGWYNDNTIRDTDWMYVFFGEAGIIEWTLDAEQPVLGFVLSGNCADGVYIENEMTAGPCSPATLVFQGNPGELAVIWVGPAEYNGPPGFQGFEFNYVADFTGLEQNGCIATENLSFDGIKSLYR